MKICSCASHHALFLNSCTKPIILSLLWWDYHRSNWKKSMTNTYTKFHKMRLKCSQMQVTWASLVSQFTGGKKVQWPFGYESILTILTLVLVRPGLLIRSYIIPVITFWLKTILIWLNWIRIPLILPTTYLSGAKCISNIWSR